MTCWSVQASSVRKEQRRNKLTVIDSSASFSINSSAVGSLAAPFCPFFGVPARLLLLSDATLRLGFLLGLGLARLDD